MTYLRQSLMEVRDNLRTTYQPDPREVDIAAREAVRRRHEKQLTVVDFSNEVLEDCCVQVYQLAKEGKALEIGRAVLAAMNAYLDRCVDRELEDA